jgi:hypothetical protein
MTEWLADSCTDFALVSGDVGNPLNEVAWQKLYFFIMEPTVVFPTLHEIWLPL